MLAAMLAAAPACGDGRAGFPRATRLDGSASRAHSSQRGLLRAAAAEGRHPNTDRGALNSPDVLDACQKSFVKVAAKVVYGTLGVIWLAVGVVALCAPGSAVPADATSPVTLHFVRDQTRLHFNRADQSDLRTCRAEGAPDVYFHVTGVDELAEELSGRGADILDGPEDRVYAQRELIVRDCNGLSLAFGEDTRQRAT